MLRLYLYARVRFFAHFLHARPRVQQAPGIPCSLLLSGDKVHASLGLLSCENAKPYPPSLPTTNAKRLRKGAQRRSNPCSLYAASKMDCFASLAMTETVVITRESG
jgi:hypothetical protein